MLPQYCFVYLHIFNLLGSGWALEHLRWGHQIQTFKWPWTCPPAVTRPPHIHPRFGLGMSSVGPPARLWGGLRCPVESVLFDRPVTDLPSRAFENILRHLFCVHESLLYKLVFARELPFYIIWTVHIHPRAPFFCVHEHILYKVVVAPADTIDLVKSFMMRMC